MDAAANHRYVEALGMAVSRMQNKNVKVKKKFIRVNVDT